ncbi:HNH endonuclease [Pectobacterium parmentieri]|uniref:HNH endonuclease n=1 Tax=Pectobacterium parmentieri TaxID=1905730 RepID=A0A0H3I7L2_PECPM|nr:HNH endonuclease [Pectobacterium parmentieri]AFI89916.1 Hypothetical protein W5S_1825 [Pectobacterium parmentieri]MBI0469322.1 HNH endonuclease [Pectobacterium parmentieri]MBI0491946.1 HNH endonuclease [Pectobacterium parmentieri]MBI0553230.1 HNH endonuclease [Pectobacterium parmentieri]MBI0566373.1 HNH endonuclease [Pectobacterium parmentieri]
MRIKSPTETILCNGTTIRTLLDKIKSNRRGRLKRFFNDANKWQAFVADNERLSVEFRASNSYTVSSLDYSSVKDSLINLYKGSYNFEECRYISDIRNIYRSVRCPYCGQGVCSSLDHYFDKDAFCELSLNVWNLVPSCGDCNFKKLNSKINSPTERFLHPFFDEHFIDGSAMRLYFVHVELFDTPHMFTTTLTPHPDLDDNIKSIVNWHLRNMEIESRNGLIIREELTYWVNKVRNRIARLNSEQLVFDFLQEEYVDEVEFSWRGVVLNSMISNQSNFNTVYLIISNPQFSTNPTV